MVEYNFLEEKKLAVEAATKGLKEAFRCSIEKWKRNIEREDYCKYSTYETCALCIHFTDKVGHIKCKLCPIHRESAESCCAEWEAATGFLSKNAAGVLVHYMIKCYEEHFGEKYDD